MSNDTITKKTPFLKTKKGKKTLITAVVSGLFVIAIALGYYFVITMFLLDIQHLPFIRYRYVIDETDNERTIEIVLIQETEAKEQPPVNFFIPDRIEGMRVTKISEYAFFGLETIQSVRLPDSVISIGDFAFKECINLKSIEFGGELLSLGLEAFAYTPFLSSLEEQSEDGFFSFSNVLLGFKGDFPMGTALVASADSPAAIRYGDKAINLGTFIDRYENFIFANNVFAGQDGLEYVEIPESAVLLSDGLFKDCVNLEYVDLSLLAASNHDFTFGVSTFENCVSLDIGDVSGFDFPDTLTRLGANSFKNTALSGTINVGNTVLEEGVFMNNPNITNVIIGDKVDVLPASIFEGCSSLETIKSVDEAGNIINTINNVRRIGRSAFRGTAIKEFTFPIHAASVAVSVFADCLELESVTFNDETSWSFNQYAFRNTPKLKKFKLFNSDGPVATTHDITFPRFTSQLQSDGVQGVSGLFGAYTLSSLDEIVPTGNGPLFESVLIPGNSTSIGKYMFYGNTNLKNVDFALSYHRQSQFDRDVDRPVVYETRPSLIDAIGERAFFNCTSLISLTLPNRVYEIGSGFIEGTTALTSFVFPERVTTISIGSLRNTGLVVLDIPSTVYSIKTNSITDNQSLEAIIIRGQGLYEIQRDAMNNNKTGMNIFLEITMEQLPYSWDTEQWHPELTDSAPKRADFATDGDWEAAMRTFKEDFFRDNGVYFVGQWTESGGVPTPNP